MTMTDPIADMLTRNANSAGKQTGFMPSSKKLVDGACTLRGEEGWRIQGYDVVEGDLARDAWRSR